MARMRIAQAAVFVLLGAAAAHAADKVQIGDGKIVPESMTATSDGTLFAGSIATGQVFRAAPGAAKADVFVAKPADGQGAILGVYADEKAGLIWACYSDLALFAGKPGLNSLVRSYDLKSGAAKGSYDLGAGSFCNDIASAPDGTAYFADTAGGRVLRLKPGATTVDTVSDDPALKGVDGISLSKDGALFVNNVMSNKLYRIDLAADGTGKVTELKTSQALKGPDGMRFGDDGVLYLAENAAGEVDAVTVSGDAATVKPVATGLDGPTAMSKVGDTLWVLEARIGKMGDPNEKGPYFMVPFALK